ncbi:MAG: ribbon-helix-helix protein, CopG family [Myxococcaceae bacterium]|nr:ribbon-helix-helix protein, CopG family [Myxococcaceae bacterium]
MPRLKTMPIRLPPALSAKVARPARARHTTRSEIVRDALQSYEPSESPSYTEAAVEFCGVAKGPGDLSTNPRYLDGYGT